MRTSLAVLAKEGVSTITYHFENGDVSKRPLFARHRGIRKNGQRPIGATLYVSEDETHSFEEFKKMMMQEIIWTFKQGYGIKHVATEKLEHKKLLTNT